VAVSYFNGRSTPQGTTHHEYIARMVTIIQDICKRLEYNRSIRDRIAKSGPALACAIASIVSYKQVNAKVVIHWCDRVIVADNLAITMEVYDGWRILTVNIEATGNGDVLIYRNEMVADKNAMMLKATYLHLASSQLP